MKLAAFIIVPAAVPTRQEVAASMSDLIVLGGAFKKIEASASNSGNGNFCPPVAKLAAGAYAVVNDMHECALDHFNDGSALGLTDAARLSAEGIEAAMHVMNAITAVAPSFVREVLPDLVPQSEVAPSGSDSAAAAARMDAAARSAGVGFNIPDADRAAMQATFDAKPTKIQPL